MNIDEHTIIDLGHFVPFLGIQFCSTEDVKVQTDLYVKPTDSGAYLHAYMEAHISIRYTVALYIPSLYNLLNFVILGCQKTNESLSVKHNFNEIINK